MFGSCEKLKVLWKIASETISFITGKRFDFSILRANNILDLVNVELGDFKRFEKTLIYFNTIWKVRNEIKFEFAIFSIDLVVGIMRQVRYRSL